MIELPPQLRDKISIVTIKHTKETRHTKFTVLGIGKKKKKHQLNWQVIKCKECDVTLGS